MQVKDVMSRPVLSVGPEDSLTTALAAMKKARVHQLVVLKDGTLHGMIELRSIITRDIDPRTAKAGPLARKTPTIDASASFEDALHVLLGSGQRALPVVSKGAVVGVLSESDLLKRAADVLDKETKVKDIMTTCVYVTPDTSAGKIQRLMIDTNVSRIPVMDGGSITGVVSSLDLVKVLEAKANVGVQKSGRAGEKTTGEKTRTTDVAAETIMSRAVVVDPEKRLIDVLPLLQKNEEFIVAGDDTAIVTPKDILELMVAPPQENFFVQITGVHGEDPAFKAKLDDLVQKAVKKFGKMTTNVSYLFVHVETHHKQGKQQRYDIRVRLSAPFGLFVSHASGWKPLEVVQDAFENLERELVKKHEKKRHHEQAQRSKGRRRV